MDLLARLRGRELSSVEKFSIYLPDKDKDQEQVPNLRDWIDAAVRILTDINGGSTELPAAQGSWKAANGTHLIDEVVIVYSFIRDPNRFTDRFNEIAAFLHHFGSEARQEAVLVELTGGHRAYFLEAADYAVGSG